MSANAILPDSPESNNSSNFDSNFTPPKLTHLTRRDLLKLPAALALVGATDPITDIDDLAVDAGPKPQPAPANPDPNLNATEDEVLFNLRMLIPIHHEMLDKATITVQSHPAICPPKDPYLANFLAGLVILSRELRDLELALYRYLVGEIDATEWRDIYAQTRPMTRYAAIGIIDDRFDVAAIDFGIKSETKGSAS